MKRKTALNLLLCSAILSACTPVSHVGSPVTMASYGKQTNSQIVGDLVVLNKNEISSAKAAAKKAVNPAVKKYALYLEKEHNSNLRQTLSLSRKIAAPSEMGQLSQALQNEGAQQMAQLNALNKNEFDKAYIAAMIKDHENAIQLLDQELIKNSTNPALTKHLQATRHHIAMHLEKARQLQKQINS